MHHRYAPENRFRYRVAYQLWRIAELDKCPSNLLSAVNSPALLAFYERDHGDRSGASLERWGRELLAEHGVDEPSAELFLLAMPRVCGYVFNPVSFWFLIQANGALSAVVCEVNNTFGETHSYVCVANSHGDLNGELVTASKRFHVSPFMTREGHYRFRFRLYDDQFSAQIDHVNASGDPLIATRLAGQLTAATHTNQLWAFVQVPFVTLKAICLIHWQALKLKLKGARWITKPNPVSSRSTKTAFNQIHGEQTSRKVEGKC